MCQCISTVVFLQLMLSLTAAEVKQCVDGMHNKFYAATPSGKDLHLPVTLKNLVVELYDEHKKPSCLKGAPNVALPGYAKLSQGLLNVSSKKNLPNNTIVKMNARNSDKLNFCDNGISQKWFIPNRFCKLDLCDFIGVELCDVLGEPGVHTVEELVKKANFNPMLQLPDPPCFMMLCLTDFIGGLWEVEFFIEYKGKLLLHFIVPAEAKFLQIAAWDDNDTANVKDFKTTDSRNGTSVVNSLKRIL